MAPCPGEDCWIVLCALAVQVAAICIMGVALLLGCRRGRPSVWVPVRRALAVASLAWWRVLAAGADWLADSRWITPSDGGKDRSHDNR